MVFFCNNIRVINYGIALCSSAFSLRKADRNAVEGWADSELRNIATEVQPKAPKNGLRQALGIN